MLLGTGFAAGKQEANKPDEARLKPAYRFQRDGWLYVHLEGSPADIGYQHGYLLAPEIEDGFKTVQYKDVHRTKRELGFLPPDRAEHSCGHTSISNISRSCRVSRTA